MILNMAGGGVTTTKIINAESKAALPEKARAGMIAIISSVAPNGVYVQDEEPSSPAEGDLWLTSSTKSRVIYVQKGTPYPIESIRQYVDGAWTVRVNYQYIDGAWSKELYLLKGGDLCPEITGGWTNNTSQGIMIENGLVRLYNTSGEESADYVYPTTVNAIDLSDFHTLYWNVTSATWTSGASSARNVCYLYIADDSGNIISYTLTAQGLHTIDVSELSGEYYIKFSLYSYHGDVIKVYTDGLWLE